MEFPVLKCAHENCVINVFTNVSGAPSFLRSDYVLFVENVTQLNIWCWSIVSWNLDRWMHCIHIIPNGFVFEFHHARLEHTVRPIEINVDICFLFTSILTCGCERWCRLPWENGSYFMETTSCHSYAVYFWFLLKSIPHRKSDCTSFFGGYVSLANVIRLSNYPIESMHLQRFHTFEQWCIPLLTLQKLTVNRWGWQCDVFYPVRYTVRM